MPASKPLDVDPVSYIVALVELGKVVEVMAVTGPDGKNMLGVMVDGKPLRSWAYKEVKHVTPRT